MSLTPSNKNNSCPICEDTSGKCRQGRQDENYWLCMTYADSRKGEVHNGFKCIGHTRDYLWGQFRLDNSQEWSEQQRQDWQWENLQRNIQKAKANDERRQRSLSAQERHEQYTRLLAELTLHPDDRADLVRRGFTHEQVEVASFKSIGRYQQLQSRYNELLPGISRGERLIIADSGYLCPVRNADGLIVACQVRLRTLPTTETNRYRWLSGGEQTLHLYPEGCKPEGELPLPIFSPQGKPEGIALAEGTGAKPFLVSQRLNLFTIGAAGGQWGSSPELLRLALEKAEIELGTKQIKLFPDAGDILNPSVMTRWQRVVVLLQELGWSIQVGWWGQVGKSHPDIDELDDYSKVQYITTEEFFELPNQNKQQKSDKDFDPNQQKDDWKEKIKQEWKKKRKFTAFIKENSEWCNWELPPSNSIFAGRAGLGRGKSTLLGLWVKLWRKEIKNWVEQWKKEGAEGFILLGYRNTLLLQLCDEEKLDFYHFHEHNGELMKSAPGEGIALCVDSLWRFSPEDFDGKIIILDELKSVLKHLLKSSTIRNREKILELFHEAIRRCRQVVCLDGLMADWCVNYLKEIAPDKVVVTAENIFIGKKPEIRFLLGTSEEVIGEETKEGKIKPNDRSPWLYTALKVKAPVICADSQVFIEAMDNLFTERGYKTLRVDSKTVPEAYVKEFLKNGNKYLQEHKIDVLLYTPSAESGIDISITNYFTHHFAFFFGVIDIDGMLQMLGRIRDASVTKYVWCRSFVAKDEKQHFRSAYAETMAKATDEFFKSTIGNSVTGEELIAHLSAVIRSSFETPDNRVRRTIDSIDNAEKSNLREFLREALVDSGYKVTDCVHKKESEGTKVKNECKKVKRQNSADIFNAEKIAPELLQELSFDARWEERCKVIQAKLRERLPGIEETQVWSEDFIYRIKYENRNLISQSEMFWLFHNPEVAKRESQEALHWLARRFGRFIGDFRSRFTRIHALRELNFDFFLNPQSKWSEDSAEVVSFVKQAKKHSIQLGKYQGKQSNTRFIGAILKEMFGLKQMECAKDGDKRIYCLNPELLCDPIRKEILNCVEKRFTEKPAKELDWNAAMNEAYGVTPEPETQTQQATTTEHEHIEQPVEQPIAAYQDLPKVESQGVTEQIFEQVVVEQVVEPSVTGHAIESLACQYEPTGSPVIDELIARFLRYRDSAEFFIEIAKYAPECESAIEKEELIEAAILYSPPKIKPTWQKWWNSALWEVRDFWKSLEQQSCVAPG